MDANVSSYSVYPGEFVPVTSEEKIKMQMHYSDDDETTLPYLHLSELHNSYNIDIVAPGLERDQLIVYADDNLLFICSVQDKKIIPELEDFHRHIVLPADADAELAIAEYKNSVLHCYIPKAKQQVKHSVTRIVVY